MMYRDGGGPGVTLLQPPVTGFVCWSASAVSSRMELSGFVHHGHCEGANFLFQRKWWEPGLCVIAVEKPVYYVDLEYLVKDEIF